MPRRNRILLEHRERIVREFEDEEEDYLSGADTLGMNRSKAISIVLRYIREGRFRERPRVGRNTHGWWHERLSRGDNQRKLFTHTYSGKPWTEEKAASQNRDPWPHRITDIRWDAVSSETGKDPPCWQKQSWCAEQERRLRDMAYELCRSATLCDRYGKGKTK